MATVPPKPRARLTRSCGDKTAADRRRQQHQVLELVLVLARPLPLVRSLQVLQAAAVVMTRRTMGCRRRSRQRSSCAVAIPWVRAAAVGGERCWYEHVVLTVRRTSRVVCAGDVEAPKEALNEKAIKVINRIKDKLTGRDFPPENHVLSVPAQVQRLIEQATSHENLCQCYIGWCPFW